MLDLSRLLFSSGLLDPGLLLGLLSAVDSWRGLLDLGLLLGLFLLQDLLLELLVHNLRSLRARKTGGG